MTGFVVTPFFGVDIHLRVHFILSILFHFICCVFFVYLSSKPETLFITWSHPFHWLFLLALIFINELWIQSNKPNLWHIETDNLFCSFIWHEMWKQRRFCRTKRLDALCLNRNLIIIDGLIQLRIKIHASNGRHRVHIGCHQFPYARSIFKYSKLFL